MEENIHTRSATFFIVTVASNRMQEDGSMRRVKEQTCIAADTFGDAEMKALENAAGNDLYVVDVSRAPFQTLFIPERTDCEEARFWRAKVKAVTVDERSGKEKSIAITYLVKAISTFHAAQVVKHELENTLIDFTISSVIETPIAEIM